MKFPAAKEVRNGVFRTGRKRAEPEFPASQIPAPLRALYLHPSHIEKNNLRANNSFIDALESKLKLLQSYVETSRRSGEEARDDGFYGTNSGFFDYQGSTIGAAQSLVSIPSALERLKQVAASNLTFLEINDIEQVDPSSEYVYDVSVPGAENFLAGFGGVFCHNTGAGKSNLTSILLRKVMRAQEDITTVVIDISGEYATHLIDLLETDGRILSTEALEDEEQLYNSQVIPESLEGSVSDANIHGIFSSLLEKKLVQKLSFGGGTTALDLTAIQDLLSTTAEDGKSGAVVAKIALERLENKFFREMKLPRNAKLSDLDDAAKTELLKQLDDIKHKVNDRTSLYAEVSAIAEYVEMSADPGAGSQEEELTPEVLAWQLVKDEAPRLNVLYLPEPTQARMVISRLIKRLLILRKKQGSRKKILIVLDEAQEYIPGEPKDRDGTVQSNIAVEALLRQGRKYRIHCWLATQRVARLNVSALQQLHSYFVSTLPRFYDRMVISESFALPLEVLERTAQLDTGEWVFVSYKATRRKNVPVFLRTENNEKAIADYLRTKAS
jgi:hypothetical protein